MSTSETITKNDLANILNEIGTSVPYEDTGAIQLVNGIKYRRKNGIVFVDCYIGDGTTMTTSYQTLGTLPEGYRPLETQYTPLGVNNVNVGVAYVSDAGVIGAKTFSGTTTYYWFHFAYPVAQNALFDEKVDYIVEEGTDGIWTYRKWNSGIAECWGVASSTTAFAVWTAPIYYGTTSVAEDFPTDLFNSVPNISVSMRATGADVWVGSSSSGGLTATNTGQYYPLRVGSSGSSVPYRTYFCAKGRWK